MKKRRITDDEVDETAKEVDRIMREVGPMLAKREHLPAAMALGLMAAHHVLHDGGSEEDFLRLCGAAWKRSLEVHENCRH
jgi:hypothetical protein